MVPAEAFSSLDGGVGDHAAAPVVKLKRLKIHRYRNVEPCELIFGDRRNILLGPNGAGKTTLLSLISKVLRTSLSDPGDPFSIEIELTFPQGR
ncbi:hypothetical protein BE08_17195 [Sorangium cellulosum]|uniref:Rad50/SbcC-type AAA domain-containing protein n=1 Tax=Sorangium cellulosum TaxID=56 RepID=A0A150P062_SORCE|nr:hypothetical protein BE08_17195 [Sorangium cellulosum]